MEDPFWMYVLVYYIPAMFFCGLLAAVVAPGKNRDQVWWSVFCFMLPPLILLLFMLPKGRAKCGPHPLQDAHREGNGWWD